MKKFASHQFWWFIGKVTPFTGSKQKDLSLVSFPHTILVQCNMSLGMFFFFSPQTTWEILRNFWPDSGCLAKEQAEQIAGSAGICMQPQAWVLRARPYDCHTSLCRDHYWDCLLICDTVAPGASAVADTVSEKEALNNSGWLCNWNFELNHAKS